MRRRGTRRVLAAALAFGLATLGAAAPALGFRSLGAAEDAAERIMEASGLRADFEIVVDPGSRNASAEIRPCPDQRVCREYRVIVYDPRLLQDIERRTDAWGPISVMAHEVAHHLLGHSFGRGSNPPNELDADFFSGFILRRLGASLESALGAMRLNRSVRGSSSHPPRRARLLAIERGWREAAARGGAGGAGEALEDARAELEEMRTELRQVEGRLQESEARANAAEVQVNAAEARADEAETARAAAEEALREARARGGAPAAEIREAEARVAAADAEVVAAEREVQEAAEARAAAEEALAAAEAENERFGAQAEAAAATADRASLLAALLVPLVLAALGLALRKPRREVVRVMDRASRAIRGLRRRPDGSLDAGPAAPGADQGRSRRPGAPGAAPPARGPAALGPPASVPVPAAGGAPAAVLPLPPAAPFDGSGLERCAEPGGFVLGRDGLLVDAVLDHRSVSRRHARLTHREGRLCVEDLNSTNGTRVNGRRLEPFAPRVLAPGDAVALGDVDLPLPSA